MYGLKFSKPRVVMTRQGEREVSDAEPTQEFWAAWRANKQAVKDLGFGLSKSDAGVWKVALWKQLMTVEERKAATEASRAKDSDVSFPVPMGLKMFPFQRAGVAYACERMGTLIGDEMGLGKTVQAIVTANHTHAQRILVVAPASLLLNWRNEILRWQTLGLDIHVIRPGVKTDMQAPGWYVINYDIAGRYEAQMRTSEWDLLVLDECQRLKSRHTKRTLAMLGGKRAVDNGPKKYEDVEPVPAKRVLALTGTPIMNRPAELFPILHRLDGRRWSSWGSFAKRYCAASYNGFGFDASGASNLEELNARLRETVMVRRLKADVLTELPAKFRQVVTLDVEDEKTRKIIDEEIEVYERTEAAVASAKTAIANAEGNPEAYAAAVQALKAAQKVAFSEVARVRRDTAVAKLPAVIEHLESVEGKVIVFGHHHEVLDSLAVALSKKGVVCVDGRTPNHHRQQLVERFQSDSDVKVFIGGIQAAGVGLTLTASSHVVFAELDWTPGAVSQAEDRAHRIGQHNTVLIQHLVFDGSLDSRMAKTIVKQDIANRALDNAVDVSEKDRVAAPVANGHAEPAQLPLRAPKPEPTVTQEQVAACLEALRIVAGSDDDRARHLNGVGFSKMDTAFGCDLAGKSSLSPRQAAAAMRMVRKYKRQYPEALYNAMFGGAA